MTIKVICLLLSCVFVTSGCVKNIALRDQVLFSYHSGKTQQANDKLTKIIQNELPQGDYTQSDDAVWLLLDRATVRFVNGMIDEAIDDYSIAIAAIDYYNQESTVDIVSDIILSDQSKAYVGEDYEQILAPTYMACVLLHKGDESNASALLKYSLNLENLKNELYRNDRFKKKFQPLNNIPGKYLLATLLERKGDKSNADILYKQCNIHKPSLSDSEKATLLVLLHNGNIPHKQSVRISPDLVSLAFLEYLLSNVSSSPALSSFCGVSVPQLIDWPDSSPMTFDIVIDQQLKIPEFSYDLSKEAQIQLEQNIPYIAAKNLARFIIRRSAVTLAQKQNSTIGALADLGMTVANFATNADTRSWSTLPARLDFFRIDLDPGLHSILTSWTTFPSLNLPKGSLCVVNIFYLHPGKFIVQIPKRFINS